MDGWMNEWIARVSAAAAATTTDLAKHSVVMWCISSSSSSYYYIELGIIIIITLSIKKINCILILYFEFKIFSFSRFDMKIVWLGVLHHSHQQQQQCCSSWWLLCLSLWFKGFLLSLKGFKKFRIECKRQRKSYSQFLTKASINCPNSIVKLYLTEIYTLVGTWGEPKAKEWMKTHKSMHDLCILANKIHIFTGSLIFIIFYNKSYYV